MLSLVMNPGLPEEQVFSLPVGAVTIGRTKDNEVYCLHKSLSRRHARLEFDGNKVRVMDLQSKNGIFFNGRRVTLCEVVDGDTFRCGDISFLLEEATTRSPRVSNPAQTLPSPLALSNPSGPNGSRMGKNAAAPASGGDHAGEGQRYKEKLFLMIRASELLVSDLSFERLLDEIVVLAVQVLTVERISLLMLDEVTLQVRPQVTKTFVTGPALSYSRRVVDWVVDHGSPTSFADVSRDRTLPGDRQEDADVRGAMCVPINPGGGTIGVIYADSLSQVDCFRPDDLAVLRALANLAAVGIESHALRRGERSGA